MTKKSFYAITMESGDTVQGGSANAAAGNQPPQPPLSVAATKKQKANEE
jgi:hypothetical protein